MVQEFHVVRCFTCESFQVQQVKKVNRWSCKMCGEKQSLLKEFGRGSGADCRRHVQKLNAMRGDMIEEQEHNTWLLWEQVEADGEEETEEERDDQVRQTQVSRWSKYLNTHEEEEPEEENVLMDRQQLHGSNTPDRKRKRTDTPEQPHCSSLMRKPVRPSAITRTTSLNRSSSPVLTPTSLNRTSSPVLTPTSLNRSSSPVLTHTSPPSKKRICLPSLSTGPVSRWTRFLSSHCQEQEQEGEEPSASGCSHSVDGDTRSRHLLPVSSLFEIEDEFSFDDEEFLTDQRV